MCINAVDRGHLLDPNIWPHSIRVSEWFFRNKESQPGDDGKRRRVNSPDNGNSDALPLSSSSVNKSPKQINDVIVADCCVDNKLHCMAASAAVTTVASGGSMDITVVEDTTESDSNDGETTTLYNDGDA